MRSLPPATAGGNSIPLRLAAASLISFRLECFKICASANSHSQPIPFPNQIHHSHSSLSVHTHILVWIHIPPLVLSLSFHTSSLFLPLSTPLSLSPFHFFYVCLQQLSKFITLIIFSYIFVFFIISTFLSLRIFFFKSVQFYLILLHTGD